MANKSSTRRVSVIMGIYNCQDTLEEALDSLLDQTYHDFCVIMCDDGSSDNTYSIASKYVHSYPEIFILIQNERNLGLNATLNKCLNIANSEYIARMDADDISLPTRFAKQVEFLDTHPEYALVSTPMIYFNQDGDFKVGHRSIETPQKKDFMRGTPFCHAPSMVRKVAFDSVEGYSVSKDLLRVEDFHLWAKMYSIGLRGYNLQSPLYKMRDDLNAAKRRKFKFRINEAKLLWNIVDMLNLSFWNKIYALRPILIGLLPGPAYRLVRRLRNNML